MTRNKRIVWPLAAAVTGSSMLALLYFGIVSWAESPQHALELFLEDRWIVVPIILGFAVQAALYITLKKRLYFPVADTGPSGALAGAGGGMSTIAMVACCAHHVTDVLPVLGLTAAATFLAEYRLAFMFVGLGTTVAGIIFMTVTLLKERRKALHNMAPVTEAI